MKNHSYQVWFALGLLLVTIAPSLLLAQTLPARIEVRVVEGEGVTTSVRQRVARDPVVRIEDDDHHPLDGASVVFALPVSGTSGEFLNGAKTLTVVTGKDGLATARGLKTNEIPGNLQIYVMASYQGLRARGVINQLVEAAPGTFATPELHPSKSGGKLKWILLGIAAAGGAGAAVYFTHHSSAASVPPISITTGTPVFGAP